MGIFITMSQCGDGLLQPHPSCDHYFSCPVVDVRGMGMLMVDGFVHMFMCMFRVLFSGRCMHMVFIMPVAVNMHHPFMDMAVRMPLAHEEEYTCQEEQESDKELHIRNGAEYQYRYDTANKRCCGKICTRPGSAEITQRPGKKNDT